MKARFPFHLGHDFEKSLIRLLLAAIVVLMLAEAARRHLLPDMPAWPTPAAAGCLAWMASLGMARAATLGMHVKMSMLEYLVGQGARRRLGQFADAMMFFFAFASLVVGCVVFVRSFYRPDLPASPLVYAAIPAGSALTMIRLAERLLGGAPEGKEP